MSRKHWMFISLLVAAMGGPYVLLEKGWTTALQSIWSSAKPEDDYLAGIGLEGSGFAPQTANHPWESAPFNSASAAQPYSAPIPSDAAKVSSWGPFSWVSGDESRPNRANIPFGSATANTSAALESAGPVISDFAQVFRFDLHPRHVWRAWPRVTTVLADRNLEGLRVPLVTGTAADDLAGSLTYFYDDQHQIQRVTFTGLTGDERRLVAFVTRSFGLEPEPTLAAGLYTRRWNGKPTSALYLSLAPVVRSELTNSRVEVRLELNRPDASYQISEEFAYLLERERQANRWSGR